MDITLLVVMAVAGVGGIMRGFAGFGSGMLMAPVLAVLYGPVEAVVIVVLLEMAATFQLMLGKVGPIHWRFVLFMGATATVFMPFGIWLLVSVDPRLLTRGIALIVLAFVAILLSGWRYAGERHHWMTASIGAISGTMMAATSLGNPPVMLYLLSGKDSAATSRSNITAYFAVTLTALLAIMFAKGMVSTMAVWRTAWLVPPFLLGTWLGNHFFRKSNEVIYRRVALGFLFSAGVFGLLN